MRKIILLAFSCLLFAISVKAQYIPNAGAYSYKGLMALKSLQFPTGCGLPVTSINAPDSSRSAGYFDSCNNQFYIFNPKTKVWSHSQSGIDSIFITSSDSIFIISGNDTIFIGQSNISTLYFDPIYGGGYYNGQSNVYLNPPDSSKQNGAYATWWDLQNLGVDNTPDSIDAIPRFTVDSLSHAPEGSPASGHSVLPWPTTTGDFATQTNNPATWNGSSYDYTIPHNGDILRTIYNAASKLNGKDETYQYDSAHAVWKRVSYPVMNGLNYQLAQLRYGTKRAYPVVTAVKDVNVDSIAKNGDRFWLLFKNVKSNNYLKITDTATGKLGIDTFQNLQGVKVNGTLHPFDSVGISDLGTITSGTGSNDPDSLGGLAANDYEVKSNKQTTLDNSTTHYPSTSAVKAVTDLKLNISDTAAMLSPYSAKINKNIDSITAHNTRIINEAIARDNADIKTVAVTGTTTKTVTLTKGDASTITTMFTDQTGSGSVNVYPSIKKSNDSLYLWFDVTKYGAKGDSVTDDTQAFQNAINAADAAGGGTVYVPNPQYGKYYAIKGAIDVTCNCQIKFPPHLDSAIKTISIVGETAPVDIVAGDVFTGQIYKSSFGSRIKSTLTSGTSTGSAIFGLASLTYGVAEFKNLAMEVKNNPGTGTIIGGINWKNGSNIFIDRCAIYPDTTMFSLSMPTVNVSGIELPDGSHNNMYRVSNSTIIGFYNGIKFSEHTYLDNNSVRVCYNGLATKSGGHSSYGSRNGIYWCTNGIYNSDHSSLIVEFNETSIEYATSSYSAGKWYLSRYSLNDSLNALRGILFYHTDSTGQVGSYSNFTKNGGSNVNTYSLYDSTNFPLLNRPNNVFDAGNGFNTLISTLGNGSGWSGFYGRGLSMKGGIFFNRFNTSTMDWFDSGASKSRLSMNAGGDLSIGGDAISTPAMQITASSGLAKFNYAVNFGGNGSTSTGAISATGSLGIGTLSPSYPLHIVISGTGNLAGFANGTVTALLQQGSTYTALGNTSNHEMDFYTNNANVMCISRLGGMGIGNSSGYNNSSTIPQGYFVAQNRIGVNTVTPQVPLEVVGQGYFSPTVSAGTPKVILTLNTIGSNWAHFYSDGVSANNDMNIGGSTGLSTAPTTAIMTWALAGGNVGILNTTPNSKAALDITSTTKGLLPPRMTTTQRTAISSPPEGLMVYDTDLHKLYVYDGTTWQAAW